MSNGACLGAADVVVTQFGDGVSDDVIDGATHLAAFDVHHTYIHHWGRDRHRHGIKSVPVHLQQTGGVFLDRIFVWAKSEIENGSKVLRSNFSGFARFLLL